MSYPTLLGADIKLQRDAILSEIVPSSSRRCQPVVGRCRVFRITLRSSPLPRLLERFRSPPLVPNPTFRGAEIKFNRDAILSGITALRKANLASEIDFRFGKGTMESARGTKLKRNLVQNLRAGRFMHTLSSQEYGGLEIDCHRLVLLWRHKLKVVPPLSIPQLRNKRGYAL